MVYLLHASRTYEWLNAPQLWEPSRPTHMPVASVELPLRLGGPRKTLHLEGWTCSSVAARCLRVLLAGMPAEWSGMAWVWCDQTCCESERPLSFTKLRRVPVGKKKERSCELMHIYTLIDAFWGFNNFEPYLTNVCPKVWRIERPRKLNL